MYWIYLIIFILAVLSPELIRQDFPLIDEERAEELAIFFLGTAAFLIYLIKEKQLIWNIKEKQKIQKEASIISRNLTDSYSYIGEINRKMDILKNIALGLPESSVLTPEKEKEIYDSILHALYAFSKSKRIIIRFIDLSSHHTIKEVKSNKKISCGSTNEEIVKRKERLIETDYYFLIKPPRDINNTTVCIAIAKQNKQQKLEDPEIIEALASQALFLFTFSQKAKR
ncbi:MAG: hypothetical protein NT136_02830 [Candidatus Moranbacteria bacterium]|nr:hypothetical protein [Candidatus Moranbacteria bacterium]